MKPNQKVDWNDQRVLDYIKELLIETGSYKLSAEKLGIDSSNLASQCKKLGLDLYKYYKHGRHDLDGIEELSKTMTYDEIVLLSTFEYCNMENTRKFLIDQIKNNNKVARNYYKCLITKEDFITLANKSHTLKYDYSKLPNIIYSINERVTVVCLEESIVNLGQIYGDYVTSVNNFIKDCNDPIEFRPKKVSEIQVSHKKDKTLEALKKKFPDLRFYEETYTGIAKPITGYCEKHGEFTVSTVGNILHHSKCGCPRCSEEYVGRCNMISQEEFENKVKEVYGEDTYDFSKSIYTGAYDFVTIIEKSTGEEFSVIPEYFYRGGGKPTNTSSLGEQLTKLVLENIQEVYHDLTWDREKVITNEIEGRFSDIVRIDFVCSYKENIFWIEYNGEQHYDPNKIYGLFHKKREDWKDIYINQLKRDRNVEEYCKNNNITLIVIPYKYKKYDLIYNILKGVIIDGIDPSELITPIIPKEIEEI